MSTFAATTYAIPGWPGWPTPVYRSMSYARSPGMDHWQPRSGTCTRTGKPSRMREQRW